MGAAPGVVKRLIRKPLIAKRFWPRAGPMREIPTPAITGVPAAVRLIGFEGLPPGRAQISVDKPSSYHALAALIAALLPGGHTLAGQEQLEALVRELPGTEWVSENEGSVLLRQGSRSWLRTAQGGWVAYRP